MPNIFVIAGHGAGDPGACGGGYSEAERVRALATAIKKYGGASVTLGNFSRNYYADNGISSLNLPSGTQIVELHMDSGASSARGGHVIIQSGLGGADKYDKALANVVCSMFPGRSVQIVERNDLANPARAAAKGYPYRLVENGFISNATDRDIFNRNIDKLAKGYCEAFGIGTSGGTVNKQNPGKAVNDAGMYYRSHVSNMGWLDSVRDGQQSGTTGNAYKLEALKIKPPKGMELNVKAHIENVGWKTWKGIDGSENSGTGSSSHDPIIGSTGKSQGIQAIEIDVVKNPKNLKVSYRVHVASHGWGPWIPAGYTAGTTGINCPIECIQIKAE